MRILGLDYGEKRIGVAICDELGLTARAVGTITRKYWKRDIEQIEKFLEEYGAERIVVGYPVRLDGTEGIQCEKVNRFINVLEKSISVPVVKWNEALSTKEREESWSIPLSVMLVVPLGAVTAIELKTALTSTVPGLMP